MKASKTIIRRIPLILFILFGFLTGGSQSWAQTVNLAWTNPVDITGGAGEDAHQYGIMACDPYQNMHLFWASQSKDGAAIFYRNDGNGGWSFPSDILSVRDANVNYLRAAISQNPDTIHLTWTNLIFNGLMFYSSAPLSKAGEPLAWSSPTIISAGVSNSDIAVDPNNNIHLVYSTSDEVGINNEVYHVVSSDGGANWSEPDLVFSRTFSQPSFIQVWQDIDGKGRIHVGLTLRSQEYGLTSEVGYIRSLEGGNGWEEYRMLDNRGTAWQGVAWIEPFAFGDDEIHLTWHDPRRMHEWSADGGKTWSQPEEIITLGAAFGGPNELTKDSAGIMHVITAVSNGVYSIEWNNQRWSAPEQIDARNIDPHGQHIQTCGGNKLHVVYYDRVGDETVWYSTREMKAPSIERQPIPTLPVNPDTALAGTAVSQTNIEVTPTVNSIRETLVAEKNAPQVSANLTLPQLLIGVIPSVLLILGIIIIVLIKLRR